MAELELKGIKKSFGKVEVIRGVDFKVSNGEFCVFVGPSGCGKSTLLRLISGLEEITAGTFSIDGEVMNDVSPSERGIGMVFQSYALYPHMTVRENMEFGLKIAKKDAAFIKETVERIADSLYLTELLDRKPKDLSGGQRQRVAIGRSLARNPRVFLFDEPLSNLDAALRVQMRVELARLHQELQSTVIYVTHDQVEAMTLADKIVVLSAGSVEQIGAPLELYYHPKNLFVAGFMGSPKMNFLEATADSATSTTVTITMPDGSQADVPADGTNVKPGDKLTLGIRPEDLQIMDEGDSTKKATFSVKSTVIEYLGDTAYMYAELGVDNTFIARLESNSDVKNGDTVKFKLPSEFIYLFNDNGDAIRRLDVDIKPLKRQMRRLEA